MHREMGSRGQQDDTKIGRALRARPILVSSGGHPGAHLSIHQTPFRIHQTVSVYTKVLRAVLLWRQKTWSIESPPPRSGGGPCSISIPVPTQIRPGRVHRLPGVSVHRLLRDLCTAMRLAAASPPPTASACTNTEAICVQRPPAICVPTPRPDLCTGGALRGPFSRGL